MPRTSIDGAGGDIEFFLSLGLQIWIVVVGLDRKELVCGERGFQVCILQRVHP